MKKINILLVDDQEDVLNTMSELPEYFKEVKEVRTAQDKEEFEIMYEKYWRSTDVIVMDLMLDTNIAISGRKRYADTDIFSGFTLIEETLASHPEAHIVVHSQFFNHTTVVECYRMGAKGFIPKGSYRIEAVIKYLQIAATGECFYPTEFDHILRSKIIASTDETLSLLNEREIAILSLLVCRYSTESIVKELKLPSEQVFYNSISNLMNKLEVEPEYDEDGVVLKNKREVLVDIGEAGGLKKLQ